MPLALQQPISMEALVVAHRVAVGAQQTACDMTAWLIDAVASATTAYTTPRAFNNLLVVTWALRMGTAPVLRKRRFSVRGDP